MLKTSIVTVGEAISAGFRNTIGGVPLVTAEQQQPPNCDLCGLEMTLYIQFDVLEEFGLPFQTGSHFVLFSCPECECEASKPSFLGAETGLDSNYGAVVNSSSSIFLNPPGVDEVMGKPSIFPGRELKFYQMNDVISYNEYSGDLSSGILQSKIGGVPHWIEYAIEGVGGEGVGSPLDGTVTRVKCTCGGAFRFLAQFEMQLDFSNVGPGKRLYSGDLIVVLACEAQCQPYAIGIVADCP